MFQAAQRLKNILLVEVLIKLFILTRMNSMVKKIRPFWMKNSKLLVVIIILLIVLIQTDSRLKGLELTWADIEAVLVSLDTESFLTTS